MMEKIGYLFLSFSLIFLLGHSFVPHTHEYDSDTVQIRSCDRPVPQNLADLLTSLFLQDLGSEHLTHFKPATDAAPLMPVLFIESSFEFLCAENTAIAEELVYLPYRESLYMAVGLRLAGSRGPPSIMHS